MPRTTKHSNCRRCFAQETGADVFEFREHELSYAAVIQGVTKSVVEQTVRDIEKRHIFGLTVWCTECLDFSVSLLPLLLDEKDEKDKAKIAAESRCRFFLETLQRFKIYQMLG